MKIGITFMYLTGLRFFTFFNLENIAIVLVSMVVSHTYFIYTIAWVSSEWPRCCKHKPIVFLSSLKRGGRKFYGACCSPWKEVVQPHLPVRLPCYDFTPVTSPAFGIPLQTVGVTTSGMASSHSVTGGVYKARERIHRSMADLRLLAIPPSCRRVAACNLNWGRVFEIRALSQGGNSLSRPL